MKTLFKAIAIASLATATAAQAELSASVAVDSEYVFRGVDQNAGQSTTSAVLEYAVSGLTIGAYTNNADIAETDIYVSYGLNLGGLDLNVSYTDFSYDVGTGGQQEVAISTSVSGLGISYTDGVDDTTGTDQDYSVVTLDYTVGNANILLGNVDADAADADYSYFAISGSLGQVAGVDASLTFTGTFDEGVNSAANAAANDSIVIGLSKAFDL